MGRYEIYGFQHGELDGIYELRELFVGEHPTWWQLGSAHFMYFCAPKAKWHICPVASPEGDMLEIARKGREGSLGGKLAAGPRKLCKAGSGL